MKQTPQNPLKNGFTMIELLSSVVIIGILSSVAIPSYFKQVERTCQGDPESIINQVMMQAQAYNDEFGNPASGWSDLDKIATLMTKDGDRFLLSSGSQDIVFEQ